ncbi:caspase family protein [Serratia marcescens]|jgi:hypothetical protein
MCNKKAVLISNSNYELPDFDLDSPNNDIAAIEISAFNRGFTVDKHYNVNINGFEDIFNALSKDKAYELVLIYYAGHAIEINGQGYLLPVDLPSFSPFHVANYTFYVDKILKYLEGLESNKIIVLDSCRNGVPNWGEQEFNSFANLVGYTPDIMNYQNVAIAYSTSSGDVAHDGDGISHYARHFSELMLKHRTSIDDVFKNVGALVTRTPPHNQRPWYYSSLNESLTFSDLPEYHYIHTLRVPLKGLAAKLDCLGEHQVIFGGNKNVFSLNGTEHQRILSFDEDIVGLDYSDTTGYVIAVSDGGVVSEIFNYAPEFNFDFFVSIKINQSGKTTALIGTEELVVVDNVAKKARRIVSEGYIYYSALFINDTTLWVGAERGIKVVTISNQGVSEHDVQFQDAIYVYCIEKVDKNTVAFSCSSGKIFYINVSDFSIIGETSLGKTAQTVSARRDSIINVVTDNETINNFIYKPWLIDKNGLGVIKEHLIGNHIIYIKSSPVDPILIAASDEGVVYFIDLRDFSMYHAINIGGCNYNINGISFEDDGTILILTNDGNVYYYSREEADYKQAIKYIDDLY